ncbi:LGFP repeat-containing protein [Rhodococcus aetherivorans]
MEWTPTQNPNSTIVPGKMRSDRQELPEGFTKEDADKAEIAEAKLLAASRSRNARSSSATTTAVAAAPTDCMVYFPAWQYVVCGEIRVKYDSLGGPNSFLLWPTSNELVNPDQVGRRQTFANGPIYWHPNAGAHPVVNHFMMKWGQHNWEAGFLGYPTTDEIVLQNGRRQDLQGGSIYWSPVSLGAIGGTIRDKYHALGAETGPLGYPSSDEIAVNKYNGRYNNFLNGTITWSGQTGARVLYGAVRDRWAEVGREDGELGYPLGDEQSAPDGIGHFAEFESGSAIYWTPVTGAWRIPKEIRSIYSVKNFESGVLGYPVGAANVNGSALRRNFEHGIAGVNNEGLAVVLANPES